jgi:hypothetical protein
MLHLLVEFDALFTHWPRPNLPEKTGRGQFGSIEGLELFWRLKLARKPPQGVELEGFGTLAIEALEKNDRGWKVPVRRTS